jgi:hypothetical protein
MFDEKEKCFQSLRGERDKFSVAHQATLRSVQTEIPEAIVARYRHVQKLWKKVSKQYQNFEKTSTTSSF